MWHCYGQLVAQIIFPHVPDVGRIWDIKMLLSVYNMIDLFV